MTSLVSSPMNASRVQNSDQHFALRTQAWPEESAERVGNVMALENASTTRRDFLEGPETDILDSSVSDDGTDEHHDRFATANDAASLSDESDDPEFLELQERTTIVEKYEKGPEQEVEEWENPNFELYKITDRFGFVHKNGHVLTSQEVADKKRIAKETSREQKWLRMLARWDPPKPVEKLRERVWKGIPETLRAVVWMRLVEMERHKKTYPENVYKELLMRARLISKDIKQIDLDINRTYRDHLAFRRRYDVKQQSLFNVLAAYAMYNTEVGYCQGMSQIAALFLMYMDEEEAFWCLHALMANRRYAMHGFFVPGFPKLARFQAHYEKVLQKYLPRVKKHLDKAGIPPIYLTKWWFGCFLDRVPFSLALRLWDVFLLEGDVILIAMAYNIMKMHQKAIRKLQIENFMEYIQTVIAQDFGFSDEETMRSLEDCLRKLQSDDMASPPPPQPGQPSEVPTKTLGPVLTRSMVDIRLDIAEIQSRCSRANSVAGRSPGVSRRFRIPPSPTPIRGKLAPSNLIRKDLPQIVSSPSSSSTSTVKGGSAAKHLVQGGEEAHASGESTPTAAVAGRSSTPSRRTDEQKIAVIQQQLTDGKTTTSTPTVVTQPASSSAYEQGELVVGDKVPSPPLKAERDLHSESAAVNELRPQNHLSSSSPPEAGVDRRDSSQAALNSAKNSNIRRLRVGGALDLSFPSSAVGAASPPEPPIDYDVSPTSLTAGTRDATSTKPTVPPVDPFQSPQRTTFEGYVYQPARVPTSYRTDEIRSRLVSPRSSEAGSSTYVTSGVSRKGSAEVGHLSQGARYNRRSIYDNVPSPSPMQNEVRDGGFGYRRTEVRRPGELVYESRTEDRSMERRFGHEPTSPTLLESRRQQTVTEVETRVIQLPNHVTYVSVGDEAEQNTRLTSHHRFPSHRETTNRYNEEVSRHKDDRQYGSYGYERSRRLNQSIGVAPMGPFQTHFRSDFSTPSSRPQYYGAERRHFPVHQQQQRTVPSRPTGHYAYTSNVRSKHSMV